MFLHVLYATAIATPARFVKHSFADYYRVTWLAHSGRKGATRPQSMQALPSPLQVCLFSQVCRNREALFTIDAMEDFQCGFDEIAFDELAQSLRRGAALDTPLLSGSCDAHGNFEGVCPNKMYEQCGGKGFLGIRCCPEDSFCETGNEWYAGCRPLAEKKG